jgi:hypothetical protein
VGKYEPSLEELMWEEEQDEGASELEEEEGSDDEAAGRILQVPTEVAALLNRMITEVCVLFQRQMGACCWHATASRFKSSKPVKTNKFCADPPIQADAGNPRFGAASFCANCGWRLTSSTCQRCGHSPASNAVLWDPKAVAAFHNHWQQQQSIGQLGGGGQAKSSRVALVFDERMLAHRASLPPYPERQVWTCERVCVCVCV